MRISQTGFTLLESVKQAAGSDQQLLMGSWLHGCGPRDPVELPAPSQAIVAFAVARRRPQRRLPRLVVSPGSYTAIGVNDAEAECPSPFGSTL